MPLTFSPALGEETILKVAPAASTRPAAQSILFRATFDSRAALLKAQADGVKVELWSDIPAGGRSLGEWGASRFGSIDPKGVQSEDEGVEEDSSLYIHLRVPLDYHVGTRFSFTYRLVHPSGEVEWLGEFGRNGEIVVEQGLPGVDLREGWNIAEDGTYRTHAFPGERVLGHLTDPDAWVCWSWMAVSLPVFAQTPAGSEGLAMILSPKSYTREVNVPRPLVFVASHSTKLKITEEGRIVLHSSGPFARVSFSVLEHSRELLDGIAALGNGEVVTFDDVLAVISCRPPDAVLPIHLVVLPMVDSIGEHPTVPLQRHNLPKESAEWKGAVLSSTDSQTVEVLHSEHLSEDDCLVLIGSSGCELLVSPIQNISADGNTARLALLTPHRDVSIRADRPLSHSLLTPPPSPPSSHSPTPVVEEQPRPRTPSPSPPPPTSAPAPRETPRRTPRSRRAASSALIPRRSPHVLRRYLHMLINVVFWFWSVFVRALAVRVVGEGVARRISGFIGLALVKTAPPTTPKAPPRDRVEERDLVEDTAAADSKSDSRDSAEVPVEVAVPEVAVPTPQYAAEIQPKVMVTDAASCMVFACTIPPQESEDVVVLLQTNVGAREPRVTLDGEPVSLSAARALKDGLSLFRIGGAVEGGQLEITFES
ncbi:hypothetical protein C2E23DRAFT_823358 [Lenzites betulinus]|nr:hypothetical protein C2E23DRAFT_823358 [Lenzites betulinus]